MPTLQASKEMRNLELNIKVIFSEGKQKEKENFRFRSFMKGQDSKLIDKIVHKLYNEILSQIDCQECGNCCQSLRPLLASKEIKYLSDLENISTKEYIARFVEEDEFGKLKCLKDCPCRYLEGKNCSIYKQRPEECVSYPFLHKAEFVSRTLSAIDNYEICPIVYNVFEQLKTVLNFAITK